MNYCKIGNDGAGLTNQIFALITSIIIAFYEKQKVIIVDNFLNDNNTKTYSPITDILNVDDINLFLHLFSFKTPTLDEKTKYIHIVY